MSIFVILSSSNKQIINDAKPEMFGNSLLVICLILTIYLAISIGKTKWKEWKKKRREKLL